MRILFLLVAVTVAGCAAAPSPPAAPERLYPFGSAVYFTADEQVHLHKAEELAIAACMRSRGFHYDPTPAPPDNEPDNPYGLLGGKVTTADHAEPDPQGPAPDKAWNDALLGTSAAERLLDLPGGEQIAINPDGCAAQSRAQVYGKDWDRLFYTVQSLSNLVIEQTMRSPAFLDGQSRWSKCMRDAGFTVESLPQTSEIPGSEGANSQCQISAKLRETAAATQTAVELQVLGSDSDDLAELRRLRDNALAGR